MRSVLILIALAGPAFAETPLDGAAFEALVEGKTLSFSTGAFPYGVEYYGPNRQVVWSFQGGDCVAGEWFEKASDTGPNICFVYDNNPDPQCWQVFDVDGKIRADFANTPGTTVLYEAVESEPLICSGVGT
ncbi:hypothetical protein L0664_03160 [Octadecabacter sp. G9-8]|uniref:Uncharacterized protein n=1 Tax=Octadecabacter dasysiphoniae TaxID=2909341 RepID=A0ABS9CSY2_9RHOB|nr:hypothetical protein [Octadecabacter dasysiphoniae]MCF2870056.1 hypothetical protein [Octadecabacter dasysiphoniae]